MITEPPEGWNVIGKDKKNSTVSYYRVGYKRKEDGAELLVWEGVRKEYAKDGDGHIIFHPSLDQFDMDDIKVGYVLDHSETSVDDDNRYIVEFLPGGDPTNDDIVTHLCEEQEGVKQAMQEYFEE